MEPPNDQPRVITALKQDAFARARTDKLIVRGPEDTDDSEFPREDVTVDERWCTAKLLKVMNGNLLSRALSPFTSESKSSLNALPRGGLTTLAFRMIGQI
jgi:hypothetical protein